MSSRGEVWNNTFERQQGAEISIGASYAFWREAGWPEDVTIRNNVIRDVARGLEANARESETPGAISLIYRLDQGAPPSTPMPRGTADIRIENNWIDGFGRDAIAVRAAKNVTIRGNVFWDARPRQAGSTPSAQSGISVVESDAVMVTDNRWEKR